jgi:HSP20 family molecular chaperone IbpA
VYVNEAPGPIYEEDDSVVVKAELPGMKKEDVEVNLAGEPLTIKGEKKDDKGVKEDDYYRRERSYGSFLRSVGLPCQVKGDETRLPLRTVCWRSECRRRRKRRRNLFR